MTGEHTRTEDEMIISFSKSETKHVTYVHDYALGIRVMIDGGHHVGHLLSNQAHYGVTRLKLEGDHLKSEVLETQNILRDKIKLRREVYKGEKKQSLSH